MADLSIRQKLLSVAQGSVSAVAVLGDDEIDECLLIAIDQAIADVPERCFRALAKEYTDAGDGVGPDTLGDGSHLVVDAWKRIGSGIYYATREAAEYGALNKKDYCPEWYYTQSADGPTFFVKPGGGTLLIATISVDLMTATTATHYRALTDAIVALAAMELTQRLIAKEVNEADFRVGLDDPFPTWTITQAPTYALGLDVVFPDPPDATDAPSFTQDPVDAPATAIEALPAAAAYLGNIVDATATDGLQELPAYAPDVSSLFTVDYDSEIGDEGAELGSHLAEEDVEMSQMHLQRLQNVLNKGQLALQQATQEYRTKLEGYTGVIEAVLRNAEHKHNITVQNWKDGLERFAADMQRYQTQAQQLSDKGRALHGAEAAEYAAFMQKHSNDIGAYSAAVQGIIAEETTRVEFEMATFRDAINHYKMRIEAYTMDIEVQVREKNQEAQSRDFRVKQWFFQYERLQRLYNARLRSWIRRTQDDVRPIRTKSWLGL